MIAAVAGHYQYGRVGIPAAQACKAGPRGRSRSKGTEGRLLASALMSRSESQARTVLEATKSGRSFVAVRSQKPGPETLIEITGFGMVREVWGGPRPVVLVRLL